MSAGIRVTVIVCVYNGERFLRQTIESALGQTYPHWEIIAVDDGSSDGSAEIVRQFRNPRVRLVRQANAGAAAALAAGMAAAAGEYVALLDQDDLWDRDSLEHHVQVLDSQPGIDLTFSWFRIINDQGGDVGVHGPRYRGTADFATLLEDFVIGASSNVVLRRTALARAGGPDPALPRCYDLDLCLRIAMLRPGNVLAIPNELMSYRRHQSQITRNLPALQEEWARVLTKMALIAPREVAAVGRRAGSNMHRYFARLAYEDGAYRTSLQLLGQGFRLAPGRFIADRRNWLMLAAGAAGVLLPGGLRRKLEQLAGFRIDQPGP